MYWFMYHCKEISIDLFPEEELRGLSLNFHILCLWAIYSYTRCIQNQIEKCE